MKRFFAVSAIIFTFNVMSFPANLTVKVTDGKIALEDATVVIMELKTNILTSDMGIIFVKNIPDGKYTMIAVLPGYEKYSNVIEMNGEDREIDVRLRPVTFSLGEINVEAKKNEGKVQTTTTIKKDELEANTQTFMNDAVKTLQLMPGVSSGGGTFDSRMYIQGGDQDEWIAYMDGIWIMNPTVFGGFLSMFNPYVIENIDLYTAGYPVEYGQGLSGIIVVDTKNGNKDRLKGFIDISLISAEMLLEGPLSSNFTVMFDMRRTYYDLYLSEIFSSSLLSGVQLPYLWDGIIKFDWDISPHDNLTLDLYGNIEGLKWDFSGFRGSSGSNEEFYYQQINLIGSMKYTHRDDSGDAFDLVAGATPQFNQDQLSGSPNTFFDDTENDYLYQVKSDYFLNSIKGHKIQLGGQFVYDVPTGSDVISNYSLNAQGQWANTSELDLNYNSTRIAYYSGYLMDNWEIFPSIIIEGGGREEYYTLNGESAFNPQAGIKWESTDALDFYLRGGLYHLFPTDISYIDSNMGNPDLQSEKVWHVIGGTEYSSGDYVLRLEGFYKYYYDLWESDSILRYNNDGIRNIYGGDVYIQKKARKGEWLSGWIAYTYVYGAEDVIDRSPDNPANPYQTPLNDWYVPDYLREDTISAIIEMTYYKNPDVPSFLDFLNEWKLSLELSALSGKPYTPATNFIQSTDPNGNTVYYINYGSYDSQYTPWYIRLDVKITIPVGLHFLSGLLGPNVNGYFYVEVLNVLNLSNVIGYYYSVQNGQLTQTPEKDLPFVPFAGFRIEF